MVRLIIVWLCVQPISGGARRFHHISAAQVSTSSSLSRTDSANSKTLWPGSRFTEADRQRALTRGLAFIYQTALDKRNFIEYGADYLWCFYSLAAAVSDPATKRTARRMGIERAREWRRQHRDLPRDADPGTIVEYLFGSDAADSLGVRDAPMKAQLRRAVPRFTPRDYMLFDPRIEPPPGDAPEDCEFDNRPNPRGSTVCRFCHRPLKMRTPADVWYDALVEAYTGRHYGVELGANYADVLRWLPSLRPYPETNDPHDRTFHDTVYAVTHLVYTLNNYSQSHVSTELLPQEYEFLRRALREALRQDEADMLGETMDTLRAFGVTRDDPDLRAAMEYYLSHQNPDGSWGKLGERNVYDRYHPTWNAIAGLSEYRWGSNELSFPAAGRMLEEWNRARISWFAPSPDLCFR